MKRLTQILFLLFILTSCFSQSRCIRGQVLSQKDSTHIIGAYILVFEKDAYAVSDHTGRFEICGLEHNTYSIGVQLIGYSSKTIYDLPVESKTNTDILIYLSECEYHILGHPRTCPVCGSKEMVVPILYGIASKKMIRKAKKGKAFLGGPKTGCDPVYYCNRDSTKF